MRYLSAPIGNIEIAFGNSDRVDRTELEVTFGELVPTVPFSVSKAPAFERLPRNGPIDRHFTTLKIIRRRGLSRLAYS